MKNNITLEVPRVITFTREQVIDIASQLYLIEHGQVPNRREADAWAFFYAHDHQAAQRYLASFDSAICRVTSS
jgi:hypothetical protein